MKVFAGQKIILMLLSVTLVGCSTYSSSFSCSDARGANCTSMDAVDRMIDSGEIERFNEAMKSRQYRAKKGDGGLLPERRMKGTGNINYEVDNAGN